MAKQEIIPSDKTRITRDGFPASKKVYVEGEIHKDVKVAMREISLSESKAMFTKGTTKNEPITVYDTSGPYTDASVEIDVRKGIPKIREQWILDRGDVKQLDEISSEYGKERLYNSELNYLRFEHLEKPLVAKEGANVTQMHYAKKEL